MNWFGDDWGAPVCLTAEHVDTPVGQECRECAGLIKLGDRGFVITGLSRDDALASANESQWPSVSVYHFECFLARMRVIENADFKE